MSMFNKSKSDQLSSLMLRLGLAYVFLYAGIDAIIHPQVWIDFLPPIAFEYAPMKLVLDMFSISQILIALALLWRKTSFYGAAVSAVTLAGITISSLVMDLSSILIVFRDIGLFFAAAGLMFLELPAFLRRKN